MLTVRIGKVPGTINEVALNEGATVRDAINAANMADTEGWSVKLNNEASDFTASLSDGDVVLLVKKITTF